MRLRGRAQEVYPGGRERNLSPSLQVYKAPTMAMPDPPENIKQNKVTKNQSGEDDDDDDDPGFFILFSSDETIHESMALPAVLSIEGLEQGANAADSKDRLLNWVERVVGNNTCNTQWVAKDSLNRPLRGLCQCLSLNEFTKIIQCFNRL